MGRRVCTLVLAVACVAGLLVASPGAKAEPRGLTEIIGFGSNPGDLQMFEYIPDGLPVGAPLVVVMHGCMMHASDYDDEGWIQQADARKWALVFPQQRTTNNVNSCWNWVFEGDTTRGYGEAHSVIQMVDWMTVHRGINRDRVFATGHSAGAYFTSVMLLTYPEVFRAGAEVAGGPFHCEIAAPMYGAASEYMARDACLQARADKTPQEWGDIARSAYPGYSGRKPKLSLWHGLADGTVVPKNLGELAEQWVNYLGVDPNISMHDEVAGYPHGRYPDSNGTIVMETYLLPGQGHAFPGDGSADCRGHANEGICAPRLIADWFAAS
jgi:poly(hydroxyalkanoate) depolymerase family esterase